MNKRRKAPRRAGKKRPPRDPRALAQAIFARVNPVQVAVSALRGKDQRIKMKVWELLVAYHYGRPAHRLEASGPNGGPMKVIWDIPAPERERAEEKKPKEKEKHALRPSS